MKAYIDINQTRGTLDAEEQLQLCRFMVGYGAEKEDILEEFPWINNIRIVDIEDIGNEQYHVHYGVVDKDGNIPITFKKTFSEGELKELTRNQIIDKVLPWTK